MACSTSLARAPKDVFLDTGGLWTLNELITPGRLPQNRCKEYFALFCDSVIDPERRLLCLMPSPDRRNPGLPLPSFFTALEKLEAFAGVPTLDKTRLEATEAELSGQFIEFSLHIRYDRRSVRDWFDLHNDESVRNGWRFSIPDQSGWEGVSRFLRAFIETRPPAELTNLSSLLGVDIPSLALCFSFVQRAWPYYRAAEESSGDYLTHFTRWMILPGSELRRAEPHFIGLAMGGVVLRALEDGMLRRDPEAIVEFLLKVRERVRTGGHLPHPSKDSEAQEYIKSLIIGLLGGRLTPKVDAAIRTAVRLLLRYLLKPLLHGADELLDPLELSQTEESFISTTIAGAVPLKIRVSPFETRLLRRWVDYGSILSLDERTCHRCGATILANECVVCFMRNTAHNAS